MTETLSTPTPRTYTGENLRELAFPLGGVGTGCLSLTGTGALAEFQIQNHPNQDSMLQQTGFALWARPEGGEAVARILEAPVPPPYTRHQRRVNGGRHPGGGLGNAGLFGLPHMKAARFTSRFPMAELALSDPCVPLEVSLQAYSPFIPMDAEASGLPAAIFRWTLHNPGSVAVEASLVMSLSNPVAETEEGGSRNRREALGGYEVLVYENTLRAADDPLNGSVALAVPAEGAFAMTQWRRLGWFDAVQSWWDEFSATGSLTDNTYAENPKGGMNNGTLGLRVRIEAGASVTLPFWLTWSFPVFSPSSLFEADKGDVKPEELVRNYHGKRFPQATDVVQYLAGTEEDLRARTESFAAALLSMTVPDEVYDAVSSNLAILRSPTVIRLDDGTFYGWEGCGERDGCCPGSCTHVWNYAQAATYLFPQLQRAMHDASYQYNFSSTGSGAMGFRIPLPLEKQGEVTRPAVDGQMGEILKIFQLWKLTGDEAWIRGLYPKLKQSLEFAWAGWDWRKRGVVEGMHHNTYDIEFHGPDPMGTGYYLGALAAVAELAERFGDTEAAATYREVLAKGAAWMDTEAFNGEYYEQRVDPEAWKHGEFPEKEAPTPPLPDMQADERIYQFGKGCLSDQLVGRWLARLAQTSAYLDAAKERRALASVFKYNHRTDLWDHSCCQRAYALQDEGGLLLCTWPRGERERLPFVYADEVWTGIEYQVAGHLLLLEMREEALQVVRTLRARFDGVRRNPFNEYECGSYYARALASWGLVPAWFGFRGDAAAGELAFDKLPVGSTALWTFQNAWGTCTRTGNAAKLQVFEGELNLTKLTLDGQAFPVERGAPLTSADPLTLELT